MSEEGKVTEKDAKTRAKPDAELSAMARIGKLLNSLESPAKIRVANWAVAKALG